MWNDFSALIMSKVLMSAIQTKFLGLLLHLSDYVRVKFTYAGSEAMYTDLGHFSKKSIKVVCNS